MKAWCNRHFGAVPGKYDSVMATLRRGQLPRELGPTDPSTLKLHEKMTVHVRTQLGREDDVYDDSEG